MERHVVLAHKLGIAHVVGTFVSAPPAFPIAAFPGIDPFLGAGDIFDGGVEPDIKHLALHPRPIFVAAFDGDTPIKVAGDATVLQTVTVMQPFLGDGRGQHRPVGLAVDPLVQLVLHLRLAQEQVFGRAHLEVSGTGHGGSRVDQVFGVQLFGAVVTLVTAGVFEPAVGAGPFDIAVGQETTVSFGIDLTLLYFFDQPLIVQRTGEMLGQLLVLQAGRPSEMVERQPEPFGDACLNVMHLGTVFLDGFACFGGSQFGGGAVFIGRAKKQNLVPSGAQIAGV